jgi:hypothetical protein
MPARDVVLDNFRWKLTALLLAMLVWFAIKTTISRGSHQILRHRPVQVLKAPDDPRTFRIQPSEVTVVVQSTRQIGGEDLEVFVNLTTMPMGLDVVYKQVLVREAEAVVVTRVEPPVVTVERILPAGLSLTNTLRTP